MFSVGPPTAGVAVGTLVDVQGADGPLSVGTCVQTQWTKAEGGDDSWHAGRVVAFLASGAVKIKYDDGDDWTGSGVEVHLLDSAHPPKSVRLQLRYSWQASLRGSRMCINGSRMCNGNCYTNALCVSILCVFLLPLMLPLFVDMRTGETALWYTLASCLSETTPAFVYTLRAADAAGALEGFQLQAEPAPLPSFSLSPYP